MKCINHFVYKVYMKHVFYCNIHINVGGKLCILVNQRIVGQIQISFSSANPLFSDRNGEY